MSKLDLDQSLSPLSGSTAYLLHGQESVDLPPQVVDGEALAHLPDLREDEESGV